MSTYATGGVSCRLPFQHNTIILTLLLAMGLTLRLLFIWLGATIYYKDTSPYINGDTGSFTDSFLNLWQYGVYSFNQLNPDAAFGRLPGYPFFWGGHYLVFGERYTFPAVAFTQCLLDTVAIYLVYATARALTRDIRAAWISAFLYASYPFVIVWITVSGSETLATFSAITLFWWLATRRVTSRNALLAGLMVGVALMVREYQGILLVPVVIWIYNSVRERKRFVRLSAFALLGFVSLYIGWPIRNYVFQHRLMLLKPSTAGYDRYAEDVSSARTWIYGWNPDADIYLDGIAGKAALPEFPVDVFKSPVERSQAQQLFVRARQCGTGFYNWRYNRRYEGKENCNSDLAAGFTALNNSYRQRHPLLYWTYVPLLNLEKAFLKNRLLASNGNHFTSVLFGFRTLLLFLAIVGVIMLWHYSSTRPIVFFFVFMYLFICVGLRQLEMRYLLQADATMLSFAGVPLARLLNWKNRKRNQ